LLPQRKSFKETQQWRLKNVGKERKGEERKMDAGSRFVRGDMRSR